MRKVLTLLLCAFCVFVYTASPAMALPSAIDDDLDGIADAREQELLEKFQPTFLISRTECDARPAEFLPASERPRVVARNGTMYGQVFPHRSKAKNTGDLVEIHFYHLWARDCGLTSHALDVEHVSVLVSGHPAKPASTYRAMYWYAAAHEHTLCDKSTAAKASSIEAEDRGATVWVSEGKHASFFSLHACNGGCGQDRCASAVALPRRKVINIGEPGAPLNGAAWTGSPDWLLPDKMQSDFSDDLVTRLMYTNAEFRVAGSERHFQPVIAAGATSLSALAGNDPRPPLAGAGETSRQSLAAGLGKLRRFVKRSGAAVRDSLQSLQR